MRAAQKIEAFCSAESTVRRADALSELIEWAFINGNGYVNVTQLVGLLESDAVMTQRFQHALSEFLNAFEVVDLVCGVGVPSGRGLVSELSQRAIRRLLPTNHNESDLIAVLRSCVRSKKDVAKIRAMSTELFERVLSACLPSEPTKLFKGLRVGLGDSIRLLSTRVSNESFAPAFRRRISESVISESPFYVQLMQAEHFVSTLSVRHPTEDVAAAWLHSATECRHIARSVVIDMQTEGVGVDLVFSVETIERCLQRLEHIVAVLSSSESKPSAASIHTLINDLVVSVYDELSLAKPLRENLNLLHQKIIGRSSHLGEHYIAESKHEYKKLWLAAAGGGFLTTFTAIAKALITTAHYPLFVEGLLASLNYAVSFLLLGAFGFVLATKQPAMTAATLATMLRDRSQKSIDHIVETIVRIVRSQLAAALGNMTVVAICVTLVVFSWRAFSLPSFIDASKAATTMEGLSPLHSATVFYAAVTGWVLFLASLAGGWIDNWLRYYRIPQGLRLRFERGSWLGSLVTRFADKLDIHAASWATSVSLGFLLGFTPIFGKFLGVPLDVRHVTLNTGLLVLAANYADPSVLAHWVGVAAAGIGVMFVLNLGVSFSLSLGTALRAFDIPWSAISDIVFRLLKRALRRPWEFVLPTFRSEDDTKPSDP